MSDAPPAVCKTCPRHCRLADGAIGFCRARKAEIKTLHSAGCHVEVTTLVVPGRNDKDGDIDAIAEFIASVSPGIPLHVTRFFPRFQMADAEPTPVAAVGRLANIARRRLSRVRVGNC